MIQLIQRIKEQRDITLTMAWLCLVCATLIIVPASVLKVSGTQEWSSIFTPYAWILALLAGSYLLTRSVIFIFAHVCSVMSERKLVIARQNMIQNLDFEEKALLREFIIQQKNVLALPLNEPAVNNLLNAGVLVPALSAQEIKGSGRVIKLSIAIDARALLTYKVLSLPIGKLTEEEAAVLKAARPDYARSHYIPLRD